VPADIAYRPSLPAALDINARTKEHINEGVQRRQAGETTMASESRPNDFQLRVGTQVVQLREASDPEIAVTQIDICAVVSHGKANPGQCSLAQFSQEAQVHGLTVKLYYPDSRTVREN